MWKNPLAYYMWNRYLQYMLAPLYVEGLNDLEWSKIFEQHTVQNMLRRIKVTNMLAFDANVWNLVSVFAKGIHGT